MKRIFTLLLVLTCIASLCACTAADTSEDIKGEAENAIIETEDEADIETENAIIDPATEQDAEITTGQKNALKSAKEYLAFSAFSYDGLIEQLEYEKYTHEEAVYAVNNCGADWNEQAAKSAKEYLDFSSFSRTELIDQLEYEGFTSEQAVYGVTANGY